MTVHSILSMDMDTDMDTDTELHSDTDSGTKQSLIIDGVEAGIVRFEFGSISSVSSWLSSDIIAINSKTLISTASPSFTHQLEQNIKQNESGVIAVLSIVLIQYMNQNRGIVSWSIWSNDICSRLILLSIKPTISIQFRYKFNTI